MHGSIELKSEATWFQRRVLKGDSSSFGFKRMRRLDSTWSEEPFRADAHANPNAHARCAIIEEDGGDRLPGAGIRHRRKKLVAATHKALVLSDAFTPGEYVHHATPVEFDTAGRPETDSVVLHKIF